MTIIRQQSLFGIQELYDLEPTQKYDAIISTIDLDKIYHAVTKKSRLGAPEELHYAAMIISVVVRYVEQIPSIKALIHRLGDDPFFKMNCGFLYTDNVPSESSYSRLITKLVEYDILEEIKEKFVLQAITEAFIDDDTVAIDATHFEARDQVPPKEEKPKLDPKKRGRKPKAKREQWVKDKAEKEANMPLYEKK
jgi:transposase